MNRTIARILPTAILGTALLASTAAFSRGPGHDYDSERMLAHMTEQLELTEQQETQIGQVFSSGRASAEADRKRMAEIREALEAQRSNFDAGETQVLADELGEITSRRVYQMTSQHAEIYKVLTPEQREELDAMKKQRGDRWRQHKNRE